MKTVSEAKFSGKQEVLPVACRAEGPYQCIFVSESQALRERLEKTAWAKGQDGVRRNWIFASK